LVGRKTSEVVENADKSSFGGGQEVISNLNQRLGINVSKVIEFIYCAKT
jgi:hypothetical protein